MPLSCTVRCLWAGFSPCATGSACGVCVSLYVCYVVSMDLCGFHETCVACPCSVESRLIECCDRHGRLSGASRAGLAGAAQRVCAHSRCSAKTARRRSAQVFSSGAAATLYNAPHAAIRLIRQGFGREERTLCARRHGVPRALAGDRCCGGRVASCIGRPGPVVFERTVPVEQTWPWRSEAAPAQGLEPAEPHADAASPSPSRLDARG